MIATMNGSMEDGSLEMLTGIREPKSHPRLWMLWSGEDWAKSDDEPVSGTRLGYPTLAGAIEGVAYFRNRGVLLRPVLVSSCHRQPVIERGMQIPNQHIEAPDERSWPEFFLLWTGSEWVTANDSIGDPLCVYISNDSAEAGYDYNMDLGIDCMPIQIRYLDDARRNFERDRTPATNLEDWQCHKIRELEQAGYTRAEIAKQMRMAKATICAFLAQ